MCMHVYYKVLLFYYYLYLFIVAQQQKKQTVREREIERGKKPPRHMYHKSYGT